MTIRDHRAICDHAKCTLDANKQPMQQILLLYLGIITGLSIVSSILTVLLTDRIANTGGLSNMGLRSILSTARTLLPLVQTVVLMGLQVGFTDAALRTCRGRQVSPGILRAGFRRFFPQLRSVLLQGFFYGMTGMMCLYLSIYIFLFLPVSQDFQDLIMPVIQSASVLSNEILLDEATVMAAAGSLMPVFWIFGALFLLIFMPMYYQYRLALYRILDHDRPRALLALMESRGLLRRARLQLLKLDLRFWWYYLAQLLIPLVCYGDVLLPMLGISLPLSEMAGYYLFLILSLVLQFAFLYVSMNRVAVTYAAFYDTLLQEKAHLPAFKKQPPAPASVPWNDQYES